MAIVLAGHNGSGKSTLWRDKLGPTLEMPLLNADNLTSSILPNQSPLPGWAQKLRNDDDRWARMSQEGGRAFKSLVMREGFLRLQQGGHNVPLRKLQTRFPRTRLAIGHAASIADATLMFDNSLDGPLGFSLARVQRGDGVLFDARASDFKVHPHIQRLAGGWLDVVCPLDPEA
jgi:predicted ABC-type ATPase